MRPLLRRKASLVGGLSLLWLCGCFDSGSNVAEGGSGTETMGGGKVTGVSIHTDGSPAANVAFALRSADYLEDVSESNRQAFHATGYTDANGAFAVDSLRPGAYALEFRDGQDSGALVRFTLTAGQPIPKLPDIRMAPLGAIAGSLQEAGKGDPGSVQVYGLSAYARADANGQWRVPHVPAGVFRLRVVSSHADWGYAEVAEVSVQSGRTTTLAPLEPSTFQSEDYADWAYSKSVTVHTSGLNLAGDLAHFPLLVRLSQDDFDFSQSPGTDVRFSDAVDRHLPLKVAEWDSANRSAILWVSLDSIRKGDPDIVLKMHWGNPRAAAFRPADLVFGDFAAAWSFSEPVDTLGVGAFLDASPSHAIAQAHVWPANRLGSAGKGCAFNGHEYLTVPAYPALLARDSLTLSAWIRTQQVDVAGSEIVSMANDYGLRINPDGNIRFFMTTGLSTQAGRPGDSSWINVETSQVDVLDDQWHHVAAVYDGTLARIFVDGALMASSLVADTLAYPNPGDLKIGTHGGNGTTQDFFGNIDEVRISAAARSADWIRLEYENGRPGSRVLSFAP